MRFSSLLCHNDLRLNVRQIELPNLPDAFVDNPERCYRIVQISDCHFYEYTDERYYEQVAACVDQARPDLIVATGDYIHYGSQYLDRAGAFLSQLRAPDGQIAVLGNHDHADGSHSRATQQMLLNAGFQVLLNERCTIEKNNERFWIAGVDDLRHGKPDIQAAVAGIPAEELLVMLSHNPRMLDRVGELPVDIMLSGHTHGGHVYIPFLLPIYLTVFRMKYRYGFYQKGHTRLYVSSGLGGAAFYINKLGFKRSLPRFRHNSPPEVVVHQLYQKLPENSPPLPKVQSSYNALLVSSASVASLAPSPQKPT